jgi:arylsulfatase A-like enzyme/Tfp pilus assembly protein PilF
MNTSAMLDRRGAVAAVFFALMSVSAGEAPIPAAPDQATLPFRIVLITVDTLRADRLECYGYSRSKSPNTSRLARDGVLFQHAVSCSPLTLPSHSSIFTATYPRVHGVRDQSGFSLPRGSETLAARLKIGGRTTGAFVGSFVLDSRFGLDQGFDYYFDRFDSTRAKSGMPEMLERKAEVVAREAMRWMEENSNRSFFAWLHFYDPHVPYSAPESWRTRYAENPYDGEVAYTDSVLGEVLDFLARKQWYEDCMVLLTSDHGEDLGEHGENTHGYFLYESTIRVPLLIKFPRSQHAGKVIAAQARTIDIMPTILQFAGVDSPGRIEGRSLLPVIESGPPGAPDEAYGETFYPYYHFGWSPLLYIRTGKFKYIYAPRPELYDLGADPGEKKNLATTNRTLANQLRDRLRAAYRQSGESSAANKSPVDAATQERLKSLGYLTYSSRTPTAGVDTKLPDPKDKLEVYTLLQKALIEGQTNQPQTAIQKFKAVLALDGGITDAHIHLGLLYKRTGNYPMAVEQFKLALKLDQNNVVATYNLAHSYAISGKLSEAIAGFERTLFLDPKELRAHIGLGIAYQTQGALEKALERYQAALAIDPFDSAARKNAAAIYLTRREAGKAFIELRRALEIDRSSAETHNLMGSAHWINNDAEAAVAEFREAIRLDPNYLDAYLNLGLLLGNLKQFDEALKYLKSAADVAPGSARVYQILGQTYLSAGMRQQSDDAFARARKLERLR